jgi:hypothetical protein
MVSAHTVKDSISSFTFQRMALMMILTVMLVVVLQVEGVWDLVDANTNFVGCYFIRVTYSRDGIFLSNEAGAK